MERSNSLDGRWLQKEWFIPKFEDCIKILGKKNLFFEVIEVKSEQ
jgi:hypothetical protein